jgi:hypothetical protein
MTRWLAGSLLALASGCYTTSPAYTRDNATTINADRRYAHDSSGQIIYGPSYINQIVDHSQRDAAGNVHADWISGR